MPISDADAQTKILDELGELSGGSVGTAIAFLWAAYASKALIASGLQEAYTKRSCIDMLLGAVKINVDFSEPGGLSLKQSDQTAFLQDMRAQATAQIDLLERRAQASRPALVGQLTTVKPVTPPVPLPDITWPLDADSPWLNGSPYYPGLRRSS